MNFFLLYSAEGFVGMNFKRRISKKSPGGARTFRGDEMMSI